MTVKPLWLLSYDIACPKRLRRVHKLCASQGWGIAEVSVSVSRFTKRTAGVVP